MKNIRLTEKIDFNETALKASSQAVLLEIYREAQVQRFNSPQNSNTNDLCKPHTNKVDSPSTQAWANLSAPVKSELHQSDLGALSILTIKKYIIRGNNLVTR